MNLQTLDVDIARKYGLEPAILFQAIGYWCNHNKSKPDRQRDDKAWMYMSRREWLEEFSFIGEGTLRSSLQKLVDAGLVLTANYSEGMYARTTWYSLTDAGWDLWLKQPMGLAKSAKGFGENSQTITDTNSTTTNSTGIPPVSPSPAKPTKASSRAKPATSIAIHLEDMPTVSDNLRLAAECKHNVPRLDIDNEWAKFRNHHISARSKHTRIDLCWDTWCRNAAKWGQRGAGNAGGGTGQGGGKRHDIMAAATDTVLADLFGVQRKGRGGAPAEDDTPPYPVFDGAETVEAEFVAAGPGHETRQLTARGAGGGCEDSHARTAVPEPVE